MSWPSAGKYNHLKRVPGCRRAIYGAIGRSGTRFCYRFTPPLKRDAPCRVRIPLRWAQKRKASIAGGLSNQWWAMRDVRVRLAPPAPRFVAPLLACCAGKRFAFPQLRTLAGSNPMRWAQTNTVPFRGPFPSQWWAMRDSNPQPCACKAPALTVAPIARAERV